MTFLCRTGTPNKQVEKVKTQPLCVVCVETLISAVRRQLQVHAVVFKASVGMFLT